VPGKLRRSGLQIWSNIEARGGTRLAYARTVLAARARYAIRGEGWLRVLVPFSDQLQAQLIERRVLRTVFASPVDADFEEWRITSDAKTHDTGQGKILEVNAAPIKQDLADDVLIRRLEASGEVRHDFEAPSLTPQRQIEAFILQSLHAEGLTHYQLGTIEPTIPVDMVYKRSTPLAALDQLVDVVAEALGTPCEWQLRRNGTTQYLIDVVAEIGASAPTIQFRTGKNLIGVTEEKDTAEQGTRCYPAGTETEEVAATMANNMWEVSAVAGDVFTVVDPGGGPGPLIEDDQFGGSGVAECPNQYVRRICGGTPFEITNTNAATQQITAPGAGFVIGDRIRFLRDEDSQQLTFVESPSAIAVYGRKVRTLERPDLPETINWVKNPAMRTWGTREDDEPPPEWCKVCSDGSSVCTFPGDPGGGALAVGYGMQYGLNYGEAL
jgi:hypothetical protein